MFNRLQQKWKVNGWQLFCILLVFAITGTLTAYLSKIIPSWLGMTTGTLWLWKALVRLGVFFFGYQVILLTAAFFFGQFFFFWNYEKKMLRWLAAFFNGRR
jgi:hypothetical protein